MPSPKMLGKVICGVFLLVTLAEATQVRMAAEAFPEAKQGNAFFAAPQLPAAQSYFPRAIVPATPSWTQPRRESPSVGLLVALLYVMGAFSRTGATTTTAATTINTACTYTEWGACSNTCQGERTRSRVCSGVTVTEKESCNTQLGFLDDGWYRASNCYDYSVGVEDVAFATAQTRCEAAGAKLATVGMRNITVRREIMAGLNTLNVSPDWILFGISRASSSAPYDWLDGVTEDATFTTDSTFWFFNEPNTYNCVVMYLGNPGSGHDTSCNQPENYLCERAA